MELEIEHTKQEDAIEKYFCSQLKDTDVEPMTEEFSGYLARVILYNMSAPIKPVPTGDEYKALPFQVKIAIGRIKDCFDYIIEDFGVIMLLVLASNSLGEIIMYLTKIQQYCKSKNIKVFTVEDLIEMFPFGFYTKEAMAKAWDAQKVPTYPDNLIDHPEALKSLRF